MNYTEKNKMDIYKVRLDLEDMQKEMLWIKNNMMELMTK